MPDLPKWDVHHHIVPDFYVDEMRRRGITDVSSLRWPRWSPQSSLRAMDKFDIEKAFLSVSAPGVYVDDTSAARSISRRCNEFMATMAGDHAGRYGAFAALPLPDVDAAISEACYALDALEFDGVGLLSNVAGLHLGDPRLRELLAELDRRGAVAYVHPNGLAQRTDHRLLNPLYWWQNDTTRSLVEFVAAGYHRDYPNIRWIFAHGGGVFPVAYRSIVQALSPTNPDIEAELLHWRNNVFVDTASKAFDEQIPELIGLSGAGHVLFGSDLGWAPKSAVSTLIKHWDGAEAKFGISATDLAAIYRDNAQRLFNRQPRRSLRHSASAQSGYPRTTSTNGTVYRRLPSTRCAKTIPISTSPDSKSGMSHGNSSWPQQTRHTQPPHPTLVATVAAASGTGATRPQPGTERDP
ncbi:amidohydrolase family protein [Mycolicibacterium mageritense]|uniref:amidohydrolase family protein n=1 Tax=Mycolicibacterium mageritense TaxID=53462 RepID=UPI0011DB1BA4|nr:amidohydrolase family protein [Mycolicibacterium mageritense]TXI63620.1 MAG: amidohydrolase [Mycolicibacterium mageritense]